MPLTIAEAKDLASIAQAILTPVALIAGGIWAYRRYILEESNYPHIETSAEIDFIGRQGDYWIAELKAVLNNKGKVQHKIIEFGFDLNAIYADETLETSDKFGGQVYFSREEAVGSFLPQRFAYFVIGPGVIAKYSYIARISTKARFVMLHCYFRYTDDRGYSHTMEKTVAVPDVR